MVVMEGEDLPQFVLSSSLFKAYKWPGDYIHQVQLRSVLQLLIFLNRNFSFPSAIS